MKEQRATLMLRLDLELVNKEKQMTALDRHKPTGGPSKYYDFDPAWVTWNDLADYKSTHQWKEHSFHLNNVGKAIYRWDTKEGTTKLYDAKKIIYSGLRVVLMLAGKEVAQQYLKELSDDPQFKASDYPERDQPVLPLDYSNCVGAEHIHWPEPPKDYVDKQKEQPISTGYPSYAGYSGDAVQAWDDTYS